ncbi:hypothetical protein BDA99DRAFT_560259 [Phascolomyces articulosus]|uniref:Uncharacterized protein n=1 Tax=Phascolomyces articulosus TaxID=60185 RepID=A0AAD5PDL2_9FUNG|nr:hypothetical protein BDA99DRAFT_560259 [Phascolomyces articulosus]
MAIYSFDTLPLDLLRTKYPVAIANIHVEPNPLAIWAINFWTIKRTAVAKNNNKQKQQFWPHASILQCTSLNLQA